MTLLFLRRLQILFLPTSGAYLRRGSFSHRPCALPLLPSSRLTLAPLGECELGPYLAGLLRRLSAYFV